jgi:hypothetical protein
MKAKHRILNDDVYNFDEAGCQMGVIAIARVVIGAES